MITILILKAKSLISKLTTSYVGLAMVLIALVYTAINTGN
jgi:hypothetical protein